MKIPDLSIIEKTLNNEATSEESCEVVRWFKTPEGQAWLAAVSYTHLRAHET